MGGLVNGALLVGTILGPGYLFVRLVARDVPIRSQTELETFVEMLIVGAASAIFSAAGLIGIHEVITGIDLVRLINGDLEAFVDGDPLGVLSTVVLFLLLAYGFGFGLAVAFRQRKLAEMRKPGAKTSHGSVLYGLTVGRKGSVVSVSTDFGKVFTGEMIGFSRTSRSDRELALGGHLYYIDDERPDMKVGLPGTVLLRESQVEYILFYGNEGTPGSDPSETSGDY